jgi:hypothetical protein
MSNSITDNYNQQANDFAAKIGLTMSAKYLGHYERIGINSANFNITLSRKDCKPLTFEFSNSINESWKNKRKIKPLPVLYDVLTYLTKSDPEDFETFCGEFGYNTDSRKALDTYMAVQKEWAGVKILFGDCLEELREIQ